MNDAPVAITAAEQDENAPDLALFDELHALRLLELTRAARRQTAVHRVVLELRLLAVEKHRLWTTA